MWNFKCGSMEASKSVSTPINKVKAMEGAGDGTTLNLLGVKAETDLVEGKLEVGLQIKLDQEIQSDWARIDKSNYCKI